MIVLNSVNLFFRSVLDKTRQTKDEEEEVYLTAKALRCWCLLVFVGV